MQMPIAVTFCYFGGMLSILISFEQITNKRKYLHGEFTFVSSSDPSSKEKDAVSVSQLVVVYSGVFLSSE